MLKLEKPNTKEIAEKAKNVMKKLGKRNLVIILAVLIIGGAVWLNRQNSARRSVRRDGRSGKGCLGCRRKGHGAGRRQD